MENNRIAGTFRKPGKKCFGFFIARNENRNGWAALPVPGSQVGTQVFMHATVTGKPVIPALPAKRRIDQIVPA